jgi:hypothetical protein
MDRQDERGCDWESGQGLTGGNRDNGEKEIAAARIFR